MRHASAEVDVNSREFACATMYATVRRVLDIWQDYFGRQLQWHFADRTAPLLGIVYDDIAHRAADCVNR